MTAEIAILNKAVVVLAADSAMTLGGVEKVYPGDKLFPLSRSGPIGAMIYGNAEFMGVPWETLVKMYRRERGEESLPAVRDYMDDLLAFIAQTNICTEDAQRDNALAIVEDSLLQILELVYGMAEDDQPSNASLEAGVEACISVLSKCEPHAIRSQVTKLVSSVRPALNETIDDLFAPEFKVGKAVRASLHRVARLALERHRLSRRKSGVVVAGFGEDELFPALVAVETDGFIGSLRFTLDETKVVRNVQSAGGRDGVDPATAAIIPFAQSEMVEMFMNGVDPEFLDWLASIEELLFDFGRDVSDATGQLNSRQRNVLKREAKATAMGFLERAADWMRAKHSDPILEVVEHLPKQELADMAESLVSITSLRRRISPDDEDVGGPIDVATISKGDGFQWARGKHVAAGVR